MSGQVCNKRCFSVSAMSMSFTVSRKAQESPLSPRNISARITSASLKCIVSDLAFCRRTTITSFCQLRWWLTNIWNIIGINIKIQLSSERRALEKKIPELHSSREKEREREKDRRKLRGTCSNYKYRNKRFPSVSETCRECIKNIDLFRRSNRPSSYRGYMNGPRGHHNS